MQNLYILILKLSNFSLMKLSTERNGDYSMMGTEQKGNICGWDTQKQKMEWFYYTTECVINCELYTSTLFLL